MDKIIFRDLLIYLGYIFLFINLILYFKDFIKSNKVFKILTLYLVLTFLTQLLSSELFDTIFKKDNLFLSHYYFIGQFLILSLFFKHILEGKILKKIITSVLIIFCVLLTFQYCNNPMLYFKFNQLEILLTSIPLISYSFIFLIQKTDTSCKKFIYFNAGFFLYMISSTLLFTAGNLISSLKISYAWHINSLLYIIFQILISLEWHKNFRNTNH